jgi:hypothetical protein
VPAVTGLNLKPGYNKVDVRGVLLDAPIVVPITNGMNLPTDVAKRYQQGLLD